MDGLQCASYCSKAIEESKKPENATELAVKYYTAKKYLNRLKQVKIYSNEISNEISN